MFRAILATTPLLFVAPQFEEHISTTCPNPLPHEPIVLYEVSGGTIAGYFDRQLTVYADGWARLASSTGGSGGTCQINAVTATQARDLLDDLRAAGAFLRCDMESFVVDMPMSTLTVQRGATDARAHTFSWWDAQGTVVAIEQRLQQFISDTFPGQ